MPDKQMGPLTRGPVNPSPEGTELPSGTKRAQNLGGLNDYWLIILLL